MENLKIKGIYRLQITEQDGTIVGDSGWVENMITNDGFRHYLVQAMLGLTGSSRVTHIALGSGTAPASNATALQGEHEVRKGVFTSNNTATEVSSVTARYLATFGSTDNFVTANATLNNIGLFATSTKDAGTILAGNTYSSSSVATNQNVNVTYEIRFATA